MARIRTVKPEFWEDEKIGGLSRDARLLYIATWNLADDAGRLRWAVEYIKSRVFPYDADMRPKRVGGLMTELVDAQVIGTYEAGTPPQQLAYLPNFRKHQYINKPQPARLPAPPKGAVGAFREDSGSTNGRVAEHSGTEGKGYRRDIDTQVSQPTSSTRKSAPDTQPKTRFGAAPMSAEAREALLGDAR